MVHSVIRVSVPEDYGIIDPVRERQNYLTYSPSPRRLLQRRHLNRLALEPQIDLGRYRTKAVVDFVVLRVSTSSPSQFRYLKAAVDATGAQGVYVTALDPNTESCCNFDVRIQDPTPEIIDTVIDALPARWTVSAVSGLEVALDFYAKSGTIADRYKMLALAQRHFWVDPVILKQPGGKLRQWWPKKTSPKGTTEKIRADTTFEWPVMPTIVYAGPDEGSVSYRIQYKTADKRRPKGHEVAGEEEFIALPPEEHRVRVEVTLYGEGLAAAGYQEVKRLLDGKFENLQGHFRFALPTIPTGGPSLGAEWMARETWRKFAAGGVCTQRAMEASPDRLRARYRATHEDGLNIAASKKKAAIEAAMGSHVMYADLNERARQALRDLSERWERERARR